MEPLVIIVGGPTAVGKTALAIQLAQHFHTSIISADSRQCYRELNIGVAKPSPEELAQATHYFIGSHSIEEDVNAVVFEQYALQAADQLFRERPVVVMVGGTGLYIKAFCEGLDVIPEVPEIIRQQVIGLYEEKGLEWLQQELQAKDPLFWQTAEQQNPQRLMRALEVLYATGASIESYRTAKKTPRPFSVLKIGLELERPLLYNRINARVDIMMQEGLLNEVKELLPYRHLNALQTVGYKELFAYLDGGVTLDAAITQLKQNTRHYAKRQLTWFKRDKDMQWFHPADARGIIKYISDLRSDI